MTPPISPAALVHRGSVINQGPLMGRPLTSSSSSYPTSSSSSSCLPSLSPMTQHSPCASFPETLYHCLPQTSSGYFQNGGGYQPALRSAFQPVTLPIRNHAPLTAKTVSICVSGPSLRAWYRSSPPLRPWPTTSLVTPRSMNNTPLKTPSTATTTTTPRAPTHRSPRWLPTARRSDRHPVTARAPMRSRANRGWTLRFWTHPRDSGLWGLAAPAGVRVTRTPQPRVTTVNQTIWWLFASIKSR